MTIEKRTWLKRHPFILLVLFSSSTVIILLIGSEIWFRSFVQPGNMLSNYWFVEEICETGDMCADSLGIQSFCPDAKPWMNHNTDGFRSSEISQGGVLFLGDSHTYGATADPIENSFVDLVRDSLKIACYNSGIPGADLPQYLAIARKYIPELKPILCILVLETGDKIYYPRNPKPFIPLDYWTNAGYIHAFKGQWDTGSCEDIPFGSLQEAYSFYKKNYIDPQVKFSAIATYWRRSFWKDTTYRKDWGEKHMVRYYVNKIKEVTDEYDIELLIAIIPPRLNPSKSLDDAKREFDLEGFDIIKPTEISRQNDYSRDSIHFNNYGHRKFANSLLPKISDALSYIQDSLIIH